MSAARCPVNFKCFASLALEKTSNRQQNSDRVLILQWFTAFLQLRILNGVYPTVWATSQSNLKLKFDSELMSAARCPVNFKCFACS